MMTSVPLDPESRRLLARLPSLVEAEAAWLVTVFATRGSVPRGPGARLVCRDGRLLAGTIGGGRLEERAIELAREHQERGSGAAVVRFDLGPELAQCCGGVVELLLSPVDHGEATRLAAACAATDAGGGPLVTTCGERVLQERCGPSWTAVIFGAGHVGTALASVLAVLPWRVIVVDDRPLWADQSRFAPGTEVRANPPIDVLAAWGWLGEAARRATEGGLLASRPPIPARTVAIVMTHDHGLDRDLADALLRVGERTGAGELAYVGVIGSKTKIALLNRRLADRGVAAERLDAMVAPIGARVGERMLGGKLPGEIAVSVAAQLLAGAGGLADEQQRDGLSP